MTTLYTHARVEGRRRLGKSSILNLECLILFIAPLTQAVEVSLVGRLMLTEIIFLIALPFVLIKYGNAVFSRLPLTFLVLGLAWFASAVITDIIREIEFEDWVRGWVRISFILVSFSVIYLLVNLDVRRLCIFYAGNSIGLLISVGFFPSMPAEIDPWKFGIGFALNCLLVSAATFWGRRGLGRVAYFSVPMVAMVSLLLNARSAFALSIAAWVASLIFGVKSGVRRKISVGSVFALGAAACVLLAIIVGSYNYMAASGALGEEAQKKNEFQAQSDLGLLLGGRSEALVSIQAIMDSPLIGHGSWAKNIDYAYMLQIIRMQAGAFFGSTELASELIPSHSYLMGSWVEAGLMGGVLWIWVLVLCARAMLAMYRAPSIATPLATFVVLALMWDIPFSPLGASARFTAPAAICAAMLAINIALCNEKRSKFGGWRRDRRGFTAFL